MYDDKHNGVHCIHPNYFISFLFNLFFLELLHVALLPLKQVI